MDDDEVAARLLRYLARARECPDVHYATAPARITGGRDAAIFGFLLANAPPELSGPLVLRLNRPAVGIGRIRLEAVVHNWLAEQRYPVPKVHIAETDMTVLGGSFSVMTRIPGRTLAQAVEHLGGGGSLLQQATALTRVPAVLRDITETWVDVQLRLHALDPSPLLSAIAAAGLDSGSVTFDGQMSWIEGLVKLHGLAGLRPAVEWLRVKRQFGSLPDTICHGDFHPLNILADGGVVTGVIDWTNLVIAPAEMDVASAIATIATVPFNVPGAMRYPLRLIVSRILRRYRRAYEKRRPINADALRYFEVFRCVAQLAALASGRATGQANAGAFDSDIGVSNLVTYIRKRSGMSVSVPARGTVTKGSR